MTEATTLFEDLQGRGFEIRAEETDGNDRLHVVPRSKLTEADAAAITAHKGELISLAKRRPYLNNAGELVIPIDAPKRYRYWIDGKQRQSLFQTLAELNAPMETWRRYAVEEPAILSPVHVEQCGENLRSYESFSCCVVCGWWYPQNDRKETESR